jgi:L-asparaginase II
MPLKYTANAFRRLALAEGKDDEESKALARIREAMMEYPEMVSGGGRFDLALMLSFPGNVVCKVGAESIEGIGFRDENIGIAVKIHDGNQRALYPVCIEVLRQLGLIDDPSKSEQLGDFYKAEIRNYRKILTGRVSPEFTLKKA